MRSLFAPSLLRALVGRNVLVSVVALVVVVAVALVESNELILGQFEDEASILADVAANEIGDQSDLATRAASSRVCRRRGSSPRRATSRA